jgi:hypothetical protein
MPLLALAALLLSSPVTFAKTSQVLELQRVNYKPEKKLVYELDYNPASCEINRARPFDFYYKDNSSGERELEISSNSRKFFAPRAENIGAHEATLAFMGFDEIERALGVRATLTTRVEKIDGKCVASTELSYANKRYTLERIEIQVKKALGIPSGVEWVRLKGRSERGRVVDCVAGDCGR